MKSQAVTPRFAAISLVNARRAGNADTVSAFVKDVTRHGLTRFEEGDIDVQLTFLSGLWGYDVYVKPRYIDRKTQEVLAEPNWSTRIDGKHKDIATKRVIQVGIDALLRKFTGCPSEFRDARKPATQDYSRREAS